MAILALTDPIFQPAMRIISAITNSYPATVTTTFDHDYITGTIVRLVIPPGFGMVQADALSGPIVVTGPTTFTVDLDTTYFDAFVIPVAFPLSYQHAQVLAIGEVNAILTAATDNVLN